MAWGQVIAPVKIVASAGAFFGWGRARVQLRLSKHLQTRVSTFWEILRQLIVNHVTPESTYINCQLYFTIHVAHENSPNCNADQI